MVSSGVAYMEDCRSFSNSVKELAAHFEKGESVSVSTLTMCVCVIDVPVYIHTHNYCMEIDQIDGCGFVHSSELVNFVPLGR